MKNNTIRIFAAVLLVVWICQATTGLFFYGVKREMCQLERLMKTQQEQPIELAFSDNASISWEEQGKEFMYGGKLYDIISIHKSASGTTVTAIHDKEESDVVNEFFKVESQRKKSPDGTQTGKSNFELQTILFQFHEILLHRISQIIRWPEFTARLVRQWLKSPAEPPEFS